MTTSRFAVRPALAMAFGLTLAAVASPEAGAGQSRAESIDQLLERYHALRQFNGSALIAERGEVILSRGYGLANFEWSVPNASDTRFRVGSITKQFTAVIVLQLVEEGALALDGRIVDYLPGYPRPQGELVTIHQLLNHTSGIPSYTGFPGFMEDDVRDPFEPDSLVALFAGLPLEFEPGSRFRYNNSAYVLLGLIIERVTGRPYAQVLRERVLDPSGLAATGYDHEEEIRKRGASGYVRTLDGYENAPYLDSSIPYAAGMMYSTVEDLYGWDQVLYSDALFRDPASKEAMFTPGLEDYGHGFFVRDTTAGDPGPAVRVIEHGGGIFGFSTIFRRFPADRHAIVLIDNTGGDLRPIVDGITAILYGQPPAEPRASVAERLLPIAERNGADAVRNRYLQLLRDAEDEYVFGPGELNGLGWHLVEVGDIETAVGVLEFNLEYHPDDPGAHGALGEARRATGDTNAAVAHFETALALNGRFQQARQSLTELGVPIDPSLAEGLRLPEEKLDRYAGRYEVGPDLTLTVTREDDRMYAQVTDQDRYEISARSETRFFLRGVRGFELEFHGESDGPAESVTLFEEGRQTLAPRIR